MITWRGIFPSLPTPFRDDGSLDLDSQRALVRFSVESGAHGLICFGLAGEMFRLTPQERVTLMATIVEEAGGRVPVLLGVGAESEHTTIALARAAERAGADGLVVPPPVTGHLTAEGLLHYFETVAAATALPVMVQDAPEYLKVAVGPALVERLLASHANVVAVKLELGGDGTAEWHETFGDRVALFGGSGGLFLLDCLDEGAVGLAPGADLVDYLVDIHELREQGRREEAEERYRQVLPTLVFQLQDIDHFNACAKHVLVRRGVIATPALRHPAYELTARGRSLLDRHLTRLGTRTPLGATP